MIASSPRKPQTSGRLVPVDLARAIAAYGVVVMHTAFAAGVVATAAASAFQQFFIFAVPFFLAAAFYFTKLPAAFPEIRQSLGQRAWRLLLPYAFWTLVYLGARLAKYAASKNFAKIEEALCSDPAGLVFMGGAAVHLYFLPLLLIGTAVMLLLSPIFRKSSFPVLSLLLAVSITLNVLCYDPLFSVGFSASPLPWTEGWLAGWTASGKRLLFFIAASAVRCFPYICFAVWIRFLFRKNPAPAIQWPVALLALGSFLFLSFQPLPGMPGSVWEIIMGFGPLLFAIVLSAKVQGQAWITKLGELSFGIYLSHHLVMEVLQMIAGKALPLSVQGTLPFFSALTLGGFLISAALMLGVSRLGPWPRRLCGLR